MKNLWLWLIGGAAVYLVFFHKTTGTAAAPTNTASASGTAASWGSTVVSAFDTIF